MFQNKLKYILLTLIVTIILGFASSCSEDVKCNGCYEDTPWSSTESDTCYPDEASCAAEEGDGVCEKCDRRVKATKETE